MSKAAKTRTMILEKAFALIYEQGYQATSIDRIIETTEVTKGAFFYHFKNKEDMALAMIREVIVPPIREQLLDPLGEADEPLEGILESVRRVLEGVSLTQLINGSPAFNLVVEMAPLSPAFREELGKIMADWEQEIVFALEQAEEDGSIGRGQELDEIARFIIAGYEGTRGMGKLFRSHDQYDGYLRQLEHYLNNL